MNNVPVTCVAQLDDTFYVWPEWATGFDFQVMDIPKGMIEFSIIPQCIWPDTGDLEVDDYRIYAGMLTDDFSHIRGSIDTVRWGYGP